MANKYSKQALKEMEERSKDGTEVDGENGDLIPYLMSKSSLTEEEVFKVISEFILVGVDTVSIIYYLVKVTEVNRFSKAINRLRENKSR